MKSYTFPGRLGKFLALLLLLCLLSGCGRDALYETTYLTFFDTVTTLKGSAESPEAFDETAARVEEQLEHYHRLFDIYHNYEDLANLKTINDNAGLSPVTVDPEIIALLNDCLRYHDLTSGKTNIAMGSVLSLWHEAREASISGPEKAYLPDAAALNKAARHTDIRCLVIDEDACTVYLSDPDARLDVGAVAKGWASQRIAEELPPGFLLTVGGNVCATGPKAEGNPWVIGIRDPRGNADSYLYTLPVEIGSVVTSGDYQRFFEVNGQIYHHIIDPETGMPGNLWRSVTVVCGDSGLADALSTALFLLPLEEGKALAGQCGADVLWVDPTGTEFMTSGFQTLLP